MTAPFELNLDDLGDEHIDEAVALDAGAIPFRPPPGAPFPGNKTKTPPPDYAMMSREALADIITAQTHYFGPGCELLRRDAYAELPQSDAEANLRDIFDTVPTPERDRKWAVSRSRIGRWATEVYARIAKHKGQLLRKLIEFFAEDDHCRGAIRRNNFTHEIEVAEPFPTPLGQMPGALRPLLDPEDIIEAVMLAQENGFPQVSKGIVRDALLTVARQRSYHPVREWLDLRQWDGISRINRLFIDYFPGRLPSEAARQARDNRLTYYQGVATCFMVGAVAKIMIPGVKVDCLPVLIGNQGWNKSQGVQTLVPTPKWFSDDLSTALIDRDTKESLTGKWLIELAEFPHIRREIERVGHSSRGSPIVTAAPTAPAIATGGGNAPSSQPRMSSNLSTKPATDGSGRSRCAPQPIRRRSSTTASSYGPKPCICIAKATGGGCRRASRPSPLPFRRPSSKTIQWRTRLRRGSLATIRPE